MSRLRARCPVCNSHTAVAMEGVYECHVCGRVFGAGLVRVPRAWGTGGDAMEEAANLPLAFPETNVVVERTLGEQTLSLASDLPERPLVLGGCCCVHIGAVEGLAARHDRVAVIWLDAHGDLNTPESSPSGNPWGMPLRTLIDDGAVAVKDVALVGARDLDPPEEEFIASSGLALGAAGIERALDGADGAYVALDWDVLDPEDSIAFFNVPDGLQLAEVSELLAEVAERSTVLGFGVSGLVPHPDNVAKIERLAAALGLAPA
ncbi:MAG: arginase [Gaiellaceae bacterium]|nr:arginase [Gaiellaceae bacterium]